MTPSNSLYPNVAGTITLSGFKTTVLMVKDE